MSRFRVLEANAAAFAGDLARVLALLAQRPGYRDGTLGRNVDDPSLWVLQTRWDGAGSYRRALSSFEVKLAAVPLLSRALDEPSAYEVVTDDAGTVTSLNQASPRRL